MKKTRKEIEEAWDKAMNLRVTDDWEAPKTFAEALGIEIEDPEPEVGEQVVWEGTNDMGMPHRLLSDGVMQVRTQKGRKWIDYDNLPSLARDIQRKDEALRKIKCFPCSRERTGGFDCGECPACIAHQALGGDP